RADSEIRARPLRAALPIFAGIAHRDLDAVAAESLRRARPSLVINADSSITGRYPTEGPRLLLEAGIPILDEAGGALFSRLRDGDRVEIRGTTVFKDGAPLGTGRWLTMAEYERRIQRGQENLPREIRRFVDNTLDFAAREKDWILGRLDFPPLRTSFRGRPALVVVRGQ